MKKYKFRLDLVAMSLLCFILSFATSCKNDEMLFVEPNKTLAGTWHISEASRNQTDLIDAFDFSQFRISFVENNGVNSYTIENQVPFLVSKNGTWTLDDPKYPNLLTLKQGSSTDSVATVFEFPIINGKRAIRLTCSPGCADIVYAYTLEQDSI